MASEYGASMPADMVDLVAAAREGDRDAFDEIVRRTYVDTYTLAVRLTASEEDARDVVQEAYLRAPPAVKGLEPFSFSEAEGVYDFAVALVPSDIFDEVLGPTLIVEKCPLEMLREKLDEVRQDVSSAVKELQGNQQTQPTENSGGSGYFFGYNSTGDGANVQSRCSTIQRNQQKRGSRRH